MGMFDFFKKKKDAEEEQEEVIQDEALQDEASKEEYIDKLDSIAPGIDWEADYEQPSKEELEKMLIEQTAIKEEGEQQKKEGFFKKILSGLDKTRKNLLSGVETVIGNFTKIDEELFEELEEALILADLGAETSVAIVETLRERVKRERVTEVSRIKEFLVEEITNILETDDKLFVLNPPAIILVVGVNGVGKTTTIGKLAHIYKEEGRKVLLAAGDTFRAAAIDQLEIWAQRSGVDLIKQQENSDPAAVIFDAVRAAKARKTEVLICDTAGRLHNKKNLMEELKKIYRVISREYPEAQIETFLVLDGTTGQNALQQAKSFKEISDVTGIVLTKLDGTAKGGVIVAIKNELEVPVRFIGVGEGIDDLQAFDAKAFARALFYAD